MVDSSLSKDMATKVIMKRTVALGPNSNVSFVATEGQNIKTGDPLVIFENDFDEQGISDLLTSIGTEYEQDIQDLSTRSVRSKYSGVVKKVNIYYNVELDDMTESLRKVVQKYITKGNTKYNKVKSVTKDNQDTNISFDLDIPNVNKINSDKINGEKVEGVMLEFFVEYEDDLKVGDKISFYTALKTIISDVFPEGEAPYSDFRPDEDINAVLSPLSIVSRMTVDVFLMLYSNKALLELKKQVADKLKQ